MSSIMNSDFKTRISDQYLQLRTRFMALQPRERIVVIGGAILVGMTAIYVLGLAPLYKAVNERKASVTQKQEDLAWMQGVAARLSTFSASLPSAAANGESMVVVIANSATSSNVSAALTGQTPDGQDGVRVTFEGVPFDALVVWLGALQKDYGVRVKAAEINRTNQPGQVNANLTLSRGD